MNIPRCRNRWVAFSAAVALLLVGSQVRAQYAEAVLADAPNSYWRFNEATGDFAEDLGSDGNQGEYFGGSREPAPSFTLVDGRQVTGLGANNLAFRVGEDVDEYMQVIDPIMSDLSEFTMTGWVNPGPRGGNRIGLFGQNDVIEFGFIAPNQIQLWSPAGQTLNYLIDPVNQVPEGTWFHLAAVGRGTGTELYINGQEVFNSDQSGYGQSSFPFNIGGGGIYDDAATGTGNQFTGTLDDVAFFKKALTEQQIQAHITAANTAGGNYAQSVLGDLPFGFWDLNETSGTTVVNKGTAGATLDGTVEGGDLSADGANESLPGFAAGNSAFAVEAPDPGFVSVAGSLFNNVKEFTMSGWVKPGFIADNRVGLFGKNDALEFGFINPTTLQIWTPSGGNVNFTIFDEVTEDEWVHLAVVGDGTELVIYVDGEPLAIGGAPINTPDPVDNYGASDFPFNIGGGGIYDTTGNQFTGQIDEVAVWTKALSPDQILRHFQAALGSASVPGDFDNDGQLTANDIDLLSAEVRAGTNTARFDLNSDALVNDADRDVWVGGLKNTYYGDADLNGEFTSSDFVTVFLAGKYENGEAAGWGEGDWDGNALFESGDFVAAFLDGGYEQGPKPGVQAVPEPSAALLGILGLSGLALARRRRS